MGGKIEEFGNNLPPARGKFSVLNGRTGQLQKTVEIPNGGVHLVALAPNGGSVVIQSILRLPLVKKREFQFPTEITLWDLESEKNLRSLGTETVDVLLFSPDGRYLAASERTGKTIMWETVSWEKHRLTPP
jgi:WD40 repeat protein